MESLTVLAGNIHLDFQEFLLFKDKKLLSTVLDELNFNNLLSRKAEIDPERIKAAERRAKKKRAKKTALSSA